MAPSHREDQDARDRIRLYKDTMREDAMEFDDPAVRAPAKQVLKNAERVTAYGSDDIDKVACIDERE